MYGNMQSNTFAGSTSGGYSSKLASGAHRIRISDKRLHSAKHEGSRNINNLLNTEEDEEVRNTMPLNNSLIS